MFARVSVAFGVERTSWFPSAEARSVVVREERASHLLRCASPSSADLCGFGRRGGVRQGGEGGWRGKGVGNRAK